VGPHTVESSARDVLNLLRELRMFPHMLVGHSFGGKVVMSMAHQFGLRLPRPVQVRPVSHLLPWLVCLIVQAAPKSAAGLSDVVGWRVLRYVNLSHV